MMKASRPLPISRLSETSWNPRNARARRSTPLPLASSWRYPIPGGESFLRKATDYDAWLARTNRRLQKMQTAGRTPAGR